MKIFNKKRGIILATSGNAVKYSEFLCTGYSNFRLRTLAEKIRLQQLKIIKKLIS